MKNKCLYLFPPLLLCQVAASAHDINNARQNVPYNFYADPFGAIEHFDEQAGCSGYLRTGYIRSSVGSSETVSASAVGGQLNCYFAINNHTKLHLAAFTSVDTGLNHDNDSNIHGDFFDSDKDSYLLLGEAHFTLSFDSFEAHLGRQLIDTPHMGSDDLRMVPNLFEAYLVEFHLSDSTHSGIGFVRRMAGWENGADQSHFESVGDAFGGDGNQSWMGWLKHEGTLFNGSLWYYKVVDNVQITYADISHEGKFANDVGYNLALQGDWGEDIGKGEMGDIEARTWGIAGSISYQKLTSTFAYNENKSDKGALPSLGGGPFFTSMEDQTLDAITGKDATATLVVLEYAATDNLTFGTALGQFRADDKSDYDVEELDLYLSYSFKEVISFQATFAQVNDKNVTGKDHQFRVIGTYSY